MENLQRSSDGTLHHLLAIRDLDKKNILDILETAQQFFHPNTNKLIKNNSLKAFTVANIFFEPSTRTRSTFELAAKRLGANVLNLSISESATSKGESLRDTVLNLKAMQCEIFVIRHPQSGAAHFVAKQLHGKASVINAGDGCHAHPTQALLDMYTLRQHHKKFPDLTVAIIGDILHSRVARSQIEAMHVLGFKEIRVVGPKTLIPKHISQLGVKVFHRLEDGIEGVDVAMMLRLQKERMRQGLLPNGNAFYREYGLTQHKFKLAHPNAIIIHPGPVNRGVEIESELADSSRSVILSQVTNGVAIRMGIMSKVAKNLEGFHG